MAKTYRKYLRRITFITLALLILYLLLFLLIFLPLIMSDEPITNKNQQIINIIYRIFESPSHLIQQHIKGANQRYPTLAFTVMNLLVQAHIIYGLMKIFQHFRKSKANNGNEKEIE